jgi:imidazolonepropionase-like amidohydrolase
VREALPAEFLKRMTPPRNPQEAAAAAEADIKGGSDIIKLFTGSWVGRGKVLPMPEPIAAAAAAVAHRHHQLVFTHPSSLAGIQVAIDSGVDVLAHAPDDVRGVNDAVLRSAVAKHMSMIPTLKLFKEDEDIAEIRNIVRRFHSFGGQLIFGTDTGYLTDYDVSEEFRQLGQTGLSVTDILRMLTENPARKFGVQRERGTIAPGMAADVTVLAADPAADVTAFSKVAYTIRAGRVIYRK